MTSALPLGPPDIGDADSDTPCMQGHSAAKRFMHPEVGVLELTCQRLLDPDRSHHLLVCTAIPASESYEKLQLLSVIGTQHMVSRTLPNA